jgi:hypothetical protein
MKKVLLAFSFLALGLSAQAANSTGTVTIVFTPLNVSQNGVLETDLRQEGDQILGNTSVTDNGFINLTVKDGNYAGFTGKNLTNLNCNAAGCDGFINGYGVNLQNKSTQDEKGASFVETTGTVNDNVYSSKYSGEKLSIFSINSLDLVQQSEGKYVGQIALPTGFYEVRLKAEGSMSGFLADPALVAIFLGAPISNGSGDIH